MSYDDGPSMFQDQLAEKVRPFIDLVDNMRSIGIDKELPLPAIAVVGDQSSGKSSVLETLSGVALPRGTGIVTRCPLLLQLCNDRTVKWAAVISYGEKVFEFDEPSEVVNHVEQAQNELAGEGLGICEHLITLKITSSTVCDLSLIDLPGIARVAVKGQPDDIGAQIKNLILKFIKNKRTIILVVVPCNVDIATTEALKMAQEVDPEGTRTQAILTKPDLIDPGAEKNVLEIVHNKVIFLNMGYVVVKCRGQKNIDENMSITDAIEEELEFFQNHEHFRSLLREEKASTKCLATKLSNALVKHIKKSLPQMSATIKERLVEVKHLLSQIEDRPPPLEPAEKRKYLIQVITDFNDQITQLSNGDIIVEENLFDLMRKEFTEWMICLENAKSHYHEVVQQVVDEYDQKHRGSELPGFTNYRVFQHVVQKLVAELKRPAMMTIQTIRGVLPSPKRSNRYYLLVTSGPSAATEATRDASSGSSGFYTEIATLPPQEVEKLWHGPSNPQFYSCIIESILTSCITAWYGKSTTLDHMVLQRVVRTAQYITGAELRAIQDIYIRRCERKARKIVKDPSHVSHRMFSQLPHGKRFLNRLLNLFYPQAL
uniref:Dynamin-type G domain-containing protein n=1 Tax=Salmo trutta TaxID=8032 RepID=A0A673ZH06_SALTR